MQKKLIRNNTLDPNLSDISYSFDKVCEQLSYLNNSWLLQQEKVSILIFGNENWLTHYLLHFYTEYNFSINITFVSFFKPIFLKHSRYKNIDSRQIKHIQELEEVITLCNPQVTIYSDNERDCGETSFLKLYTKNVSQVEKICQILQKKNVQKLVLFSDSSVYHKKQTRENETLTPDSLLGKSFEEMEQVSLQYNIPEKFEIYCLRLAPVYGVKIIDGIMKIAHLVANGYILGSIDEISQISIVSVEDVMISSFLILAAPKPGYQIFNISSESVDFKSVLQLLDENIKKSKILGINSKLADILGIGYQDQITISQQFFEQIGIFFEHSNDFFNQLRFRKKKYIFNNSVARYILNLGEINNKRFHDMFGWIPDTKKIKKALPEAILWHKEQNWKEFTQEKIYDMYTEQTLIPINDETVRILKELHSYAQQTRKVNKNLSISIENFPKIDIDIKSLYIFFQEAWTHIPTQLGKGNRKQFIPEFFPSILQNALHIVRHEQSVAERTFPENLSKQIYSFTQSMGEFDSHKIRFYCEFIVLSKAFLSLQKYFEMYKDFLEILPDKNIGILFSSDTGDIAIQIKIKNQKISLHSLRKEIDVFPNSWSFEKKLIELKKTANLYLTLGLQLKPLFQDAISGDFFKRALYNIGKYYFVQELNKKYIQLLIQKITTQNIDTHYLFLDNTSQIKLGFSIKNGKITKTTLSFLSMANKLLEVTQDIKKMTLLLEKPSINKEKYVFLQIRTIKKLLASKFTNMLLKWLLGTKSNGEKV